MVIKKFPDISTADQHGLLAVGGDLEVESLLLAYRNGIFPWPYDDEYLTWFAPPKRAILKFDNLHIAQSLKREKNRNWAVFKIDFDFENVIKECQKLINRKDQTGTWITNEMLEAYIELHKAGYAHSFECYKDDKLVGGLYGVNINNFFAAESMFYRYPNASKLTIWFMMEFFKLFGLNWVDIQVRTDTLSKFGAIEISREKYTKLLNTAIDQDISIFCSKNFNYAKNKLSFNFSTI
jgi:leucyl/phenylalanyl-tRNA--protein transferase